MDSKARLAAQLFKKIAQPEAHAGIPAAAVRCRVFAEQHEQLFSRLAVAFEKRNIPLQSYFSFFTKQLKKGVSDVKLLGDPTVLQAFGQTLERRLKIERAWKLFRKSVENLASMCVAAGCYSSRDYFRELVQQKKLPGEYVSGRLSIYFFAAIPGFKKAIPKLDPIARGDFAKLYSQFELYSSEINQACLMKTNRKLRPFELVDEAISSIRKI